MGAIDSTGRVKWIRHPYDIMRREAMACLEVLYGGNWHRPVVFCDSFQEMMAHYGHWPTPIAGVDVPRHIVEITEVMRTIDEFEKYKADCFGYPELRHNIAKIRQAGGGRRFREWELRRWLAGLVPTRLDTTAGKVLDVNDEIRQSADLTKCPALRVAWAYHEGANLDPAQASTTDIADLWHLAGAVYCDVAFADKRTIEALRKGKYDKIPRRNSEFERWLQTL